MTAASIEPTPVSEAPAATLALHSVLSAGNPWDELASTTANPAITFGYARSFGAARSAPLERRLAPRLGWNLSVFQGKAAATDSGASGAFELTAPEQIDVEAPAFQSLYVTKWKRFGNSVRQLCNAFRVAEMWAMENVAFVDAHPMFSGDSVGRFELSWGRTAPAGRDPPRRSGLAGDFFCVGGLGLRPSPQDQARQITKHVRPLLIGPLRKPHREVADGDLVMHFRGGDIFPPRKGLPHPRYAQPPAAFYIAAAERERPKRVWLVFEDRRNPAVDIVAAALTQKGMPVRYQSASLIEDLSVLLSARCLVVGNGTFTTAIAALSTRARRIYQFREAPEILTRLGLQTMIGWDTPGDYRSEVTAEWRATPAQLAMMRTYPKANIDFAPLAPSASRAER